MPELVLMPAPVTTTTLRDLSKESATSCSSSAQAGSICCVGMAGRLENAVLATTRHRSN